MSLVSDIGADSWQDAVLNSEKPVVVDFWHDKCGWCLKLNPVFEQLPEKIDNAKFYKFNVLDSNENRHLALDNGVMGTPTIKVFCDGRDVGEVIGFRSLEALTEEIKRILENKDLCLEQSSPLE